MELCVSFDVNFKQCGSASGALTPKFKIKHLFTIIQRGPGRKTSGGVVSLLVKEQNSYLTLLLKSFRNPR